MPVFRITAFDKLIKVASFYRISLQGEILISPEVINPEFFCPWCFRGRLSVKEDDICLYSLSIEKTCWKPQKRMHITFMEEFASDGLSCSAFKKHIVRDNHSSPSMLFEKGPYMLYKIQLFV